MADFNVTEDWLSPPQGSIATLIQCDSALTTRLHNRAHVLSYATPLAALAAVCVFGLLGNMTVVVTYAVKRNKCTANYLMFALGCIDLASCVILHPYVIYKHVRYYDTLEYTCRIFEYLIHYTLAVHVGIFTTVVVDRYYVVCRPSRFVHSYNRIVAMTFMTIFGSLILCSPLLIFFGHKPVTLQHEPCMFQANVCDITSIAKDSPFFTLYVWASFTFAVISVIFIIVMYFVIQHTIKRKRREIVPGSDQESNTHDPSHNDNISRTSSISKGIIKSMVFEPVSIKLDHTPESISTVGLGYLPKRHDSISLPGVEVPYDSPPPSPTHHLATDMCLATKRPSLVLPARSSIDSNVSIVEVEIPDPSSFLSVGEYRKSPPLRRSASKESNHSNDSALINNNLMPNIRKESVCLPAITISQDIETDNKCLSNESLNSDTDDTITRRCKYLEQFQFMSHRNSLVPPSERPLQLPVTTNLSVDASMRRASDSVFERRRGGYSTSTDDHFLSVEQALFSLERDYRKRAQSTPDARSFTGTPPITDYTIYNCVNFLAPVETTSEPRSPRKPSLKKLVTFEEEEYVSTDAPPSIATTLQHRGGRNQASIQFSNIFFIIISAFMLLWIPYWVINILEIVSPSTWSHWRVVPSGGMGCLYNLFFLDNALPPLFYFLLSPAFRQDFRSVAKQLLKGNFRCCGPTPRAWRRRKHKS